MNNTATRKDKEITKLKDKEYGEHIGRPIHLIEMQLADVDAMEKKAQAELFGSDSLCWLDPDSRSARRMKLGAEKIRSHCAKIIEDADDASKEVLKFAYYQRGLYAVWHRLPKSVEDSLRYYAEAVDDFSAAIQLDKSYIEAYVGRALARELMISPNFSLTDPRWTKNRTSKNLTGKQLQLLERAVDDITLALLLTARFGKQKDGKERQARYPSYLRQRQDMLLLRYRLFLRLGRHKSALRDLQIVVQESEWRDNSKMPYQESIVALSKKINGVNVSTKDGDISAASQGWINKQMCTRGNEASCQNLPQTDKEYDVRFFASSDLRGRAHAIAFKFDQVAKRCAGGNKEACFASGQLRRRGRWGGSGPPQHFDLALEFFRKGCDLSHEKSCFLAGALYHSGNFYNLDSRKITPTDSKHAENYFSKSCELGNARSCKLTAAVIKSRKDAGKDNRGRLVKLYAQACEGGAKGVCSKAGLMRKQTDGKKLSYFLKACSEGRSVGCFNSGVFLSTGLTGRTDKSFARNNYLRACELGDREGCYNAGYLFLEGFGGARDVKRARSLLEKACDKNGPEACAVLASLYPQGPGGTPDKLATKYNERACYAGHADACVNLVIAESAEQQRFSWRTYFHLENACDLGRKDACAIQKNLELYSKLK